MARCTGTTSPVVGALVPLIAAATGAEPDHVDPLLADSMRSGSWSLIDDEGETPRVRTRAEILAQHGLADSEPERVIHGTVVAESADSTAGNKFVSGLSASSPLEAIENRITAVSRQYCGELGTLLQLIREHRKWGTAGYASWEVPVSGRELPTLAQALGRGRWAGCVAELLRTARL